MDTIVNIIYVIMIIFSIALVIAIIKGNYFFDKVFKRKKGNTIYQNNNLKYIEGNMGSTGMPNLDSDDYYDNAISAPLIPKESNNKK